MKNLKTLLKKFHPIELIELIIQWEFMTSIKILEKTIGTT
mgnify:CR=1 FL=1